MLIGMALAAMTGRRYVGYVDADNYVPGAVNEYCKAYAAGLHLADSPYAMVRISWHSKPKLRDGRLFFSRRGRSSEITNRFLNRLRRRVLGLRHRGDRHRQRRRARAQPRPGPAACGWPAASRSSRSSIVELFEQFGGVLPRPDADVLAGSVPVLQIETRNPHFHDDKGEDHVRGMRMQALNVLYHSPVALPGVARRYATSWSPRAAGAGQRAAAGADLPAGRHARARPALRHAHAEAETLPPGGATPAAPHPGRVADPA